MSKKSPRRTRPRTSRKPPRAPNKARVDSASDVANRALIAAHEALPEDIRSPPATAVELAAFEAEFGPIPPIFRWYLERCGGGVVGAEWVDDIHQLADSHRKFRREFGPPRGWTMTDVFIIGWDGGGNPFGICAKTGHVLVEDHDFGGIHVMATSFEQFLAKGLAS
jgi:hypothetical protein